MRKLFVILLMLATVLRAEAQSETSTSATSLCFEEVEWNFGRIEEGAGKVSHTFTYTNLADHPVAIERVYSSCGCTTGDYSRRPLKAGAKGEFTITYDPDGRPGRFDKQITIVFDEGRGRVDLRVKGVVKGRKRSELDIYPRALGAGVRADATYKAFGNVAMQTTKSMTFAIANTSSEGVRLEVVWKERSGALELFVPDTLAAGEKALLTATYAMVGEGARYGVVRDRVGLLINGQPATEDIVTTAIGVDYFDRNSSADKPKAYLEPSYHDFGEVEVPSVQVCRMVLRNDGDAPLVVRSVTPREGTTIGLAAGTTIAPAESVVVEVALEVPRGSYDTIFGGGMIVVNDPARPVRELRVGATIK